METFSALLVICAGNSPVTGEYPAQRPVTRSFGVFFYLHLNKRLSKQSSGWWFETPSSPLWRHCNVLLSMMLTSWHGNVFRITGSLRAEFTGNRWLPSRIKRPVMRTFNVFSVAGFTGPVAGPIMEWLVQWRPVNGGGYQRFWISFSWPDDQNTSIKMADGISGYSATLRRLRRRYYLVSSTQSLVLLVISPLRLDFRGVRSVVHVELVDIGF